MLQYNSRIYSILSGFYVTVKHWQDNWEEGKWPFTDFLETKIEQSVFICVQFSWVNNSYNHFPLLLQLLVLQIESSPFRDFVCLELGCPTPDLKGQFWLNLHSNTADSNGPTTSSALQSSAESFWWTFNFIQR